MTAIDANPIKTPRPSLAKQAGVYALRNLIPLAARFLQPQDPGPEPEPFTAVGVPRIAKASASARSEPVRCDIYLPGYLTAASSSTDTDAEHTSLPQHAELPVIVNLHGSGFCLYAMGDDARFCQQMADDVDAVVVDVDYAKAPEYPYPHANDDVDAVLAWIRQGSNQDQDSPSQIIHKQSHGKQSVKKDCIALTGFSAGGNLVLTACVRAQKEKRLPEIRAVAAFYPSTNLAERPHLKPNVKPAKGASGGVLPAPMRRFFYSCYIPIDDDVFPPRSSELISPLYADAAAFPPSVTIITCSGDSLAREGRQLAERIAHHRRADGSADTSTATLADPPAEMADVPRAPVESGKEQNGLVWWQAEGQGHAWDKMAARDTEPHRLVLEAYGLVAARLRRALHGSTGDE